MYPLYFCFQNLVIQPNFSWIFFLKIEYATFQFLYQHINILCYFTSTAIYVNKRGYNLLIFDFIRYQFSFKISIFFANPFFSASSKNRFCDFRPYILCSLHSLLKSLGLIMSSLLSSSSFEKFSKMSFSPVLLYLR